jgi:hypothetical protein
VLRFGEERPVMPRGCRLRLNLVNKDRVSVVVFRLGRFNRCSAAWRLAGGSSPRRANFLQLVSRAMVRLDLEVVQKITWRFEGYASTRCRSLCGQCGADSAQGGAYSWQ